MAASILEFLLNRNPHGYLAVLWSAKFAEEDGKPQQRHGTVQEDRPSWPLPRSLWPELVDPGRRGKPRPPPRVTLAWSLEANCHNDGSGP